MKKYISHSVEETEKIAKEMGKHLRPGSIVCLEGDLGTGKTAFTRGLVSALGVEDSEVNSPTFMIVNEYEGKYPVYHFDVYRINDVDELFEIGFEEYIYGDGISIIEWADNIKEILPEDCLNVKIQKDLSKGENYREIIVDSKDFAD